MIRVAIAGEKPAAEEFAFPTNIMPHPLDGEVIDLDDADSLIDAYERLKKVNDVTYSAMMRIRIALAALTEGDTKTRRVRGERRLAKVTMPDDGWDQSMLKEAFHSYGEKPYCRDVLAVGTINVRKREYDKIVNTSGTDDFNSFRDMVTRANRGPQGTPKVEVEK